MEEAKKILIVDDDSELLDVITHIFQNEKWDVSRAADGKEALGLFDSTEFSVILSDINMPNMNGIELLSLIRVSQKNRRTPLILMTGISEEKINELGNYKISLTLKKPLKYDQFLSKYLELVKRRKHIDEVVLAQVHDGHGDQIEIIDDDEL